MPVKEKGDFVSVETPNRTEVSRAPKSSDDAIRMMRKFNSVDEAVTKKKMGKSSSSQSPGFLKHTITGKC